MASPAKLVGWQVLRSIGKHGVHKGDITSYDDEGELTFRVEYPDGDVEDLSEVDVRATLIDHGKKIQVIKLQRIPIAIPNKLDKAADDSDSDYMEETTDSFADSRVASSQASTQPFPLTGSDVPCQPTSESASVVARATPSTSLRKRSTPSVRKRSESTLWVPSTCPVSISVHFNAIDRGLCAQTLREHHTVLERAMARLYPRFKWGRSHYLQVLSIKAIHTKRYVLI
jgi:hypothetical protein